MTTISVYFLIFEVRFHPGFNFPSIHCQPCLYVFTIVSGEEVAVVHATVSRLGPRSVESSRPHQLRFDAFNRTYDLTLRPSVGLVSPNFLVIVRDSNTSQTSSIRTPLTTCFYRGPDAAFDLCRGMVKICSTSTMKLLNNMFFLLNDIERNCYPVPD